MRDTYVIATDFGTPSGRTAGVLARDGRESDSAVTEYHHRMMDSVPSARTGNRCRASGRWPTGSSPLHEWGIFHRSPLRQGLGTGNIMQGDRLRSRDSDTVVPEEPTITEGARERRR